MRFPPKPVIPESALKSMTPESRSGSTISACLGSHFFIPDPLPDFPTFFSFLLSSPDPHAQSSSLNSPCLSPSPSPSPTQAAPR